MQRLVQKIAISVAVSALVYLAIASALIFFGGPSRAVGDNHFAASNDPGIEPSQAGIAFSEMLIDYSQMPPLLTYQARDGASLGYRYYPSASDRVLILLHGSGWHSQQFYPLAKYISAQGLARVYTPDLRGHGVAPRRRGDLDYIGQFEDDLADLMDMISRDSPGASFIMGGHSSGGGLAIRFAGSHYGEDIDAYLLLAPYIFYNAPTTRPDAGGWAKPYTGRIIGLSMLNNLGIHWFDNLVSIEFNMPQAMRNGTETLAYSHRLNTAYAPRDYGADLAAITQPLLLIAGSADETMYADKYQALIDKYSSGQVRLLPGVGHMGVVVSPEVRPVIHSWIEDL